MEEGVCYDCGEIIGGTNYKLVPGNLLAPEMDGAAGPAWPS